MVYEYIPGEKVTLDTLMGYYWYYDLTYFTDMTYGKQIEEIAGLGTYGNIAGGWHMATRPEMEALFLPHDPISLTNAFVPTYLGDFTEWAGRYDRVADIGHMEWYMRNEPVWYIYTANPVDDLLQDPLMGAWVVSHQSVVPAPGAVILAATGMLSAALGLKRLRRKHQEPDQI